MCGVVGLVENRKRICLFDMPNHYIVCPDSGSVRTAQMHNIVYDIVHLCIVHLLLSERRDCFLRGRV